MPSQNGKQQRGFALPRRHPHRRHHRQLIQDNGVVLDKDTIGECFLRRKDLNRHAHLPQGLAICCMLLKRQGKIDFFARNVSDFAIYKRIRRPAGEDKHRAGFSRLVVSWCVEAGLHLYTVLILISYQLNNADLQLA